MRGRLAERLVPAGLIVLAGLVVLGSQQVRLAGTVDPIGPRAFPQVAAVLLAALGAWLLFDALRRRSAPDPADEAAPDDPAAVAFAGKWRVAAGVLIIVVYLLALPVIHYIAATTLAAIVLLVVLGVRSVRLLAVFPLLLAVGLAVLFSTALGVRLP